VCIGKLFNGFLQATGLQLQEQHAQIRKPTRIAPASNQQQGAKLPRTYLVMLQAQHLQPAATAAALPQQPCQCTSTDVLNRIARNVQQHNAAVHFQSVNKINNSLVI
jgi:hypothetical protein